VSLHDVKIGLTVKRDLSRRHLKECDSQGVNVRPCLHLSPADLFRRHVPDRTQLNAGSRESLLTGGLGNTEIGHLDLARVGDHDVAGLDVAVNDPLPVHEAQSIQHAPRDPAAFRQRQCS